MERSHGSWNWKTSRTSKSQEGQREMQRGLRNPWTRNFSSPGLPLSFLASVSLSVSIIFSHCRSALSTWQLMGLLTPFLGVSHVTTSSTNETDWLFFPRSISKNTGEELWSSVPGGCSPLDQSAVTRRRTESYKNMPAPIVTTWLELKGAQ